MWHESGGCWTRWACAETRSIRYPHEFSGGQRLRLAIARTLAIVPPMFYDKPTSAWNLAVQAKILNLLKRLQAELDVAYPFITHNFGVVEYLEDEVALKKDGKISEAAQARDMLRAPHSTYAHELLAAVPRVRAV